jgi:hypothetical protein
MQKTGVNEQIVDCGFVADVWYVYGPIVHLLKIRIHSLFSYCYRSLDSLCGMLQIFRLFVKGWQVRSFKVTHNVTYEAYRRRRMLKSNVSHS